MECIPLGVNTLKKKNLWIWGDYMFMSVPPGLKQKASFWWDAGGYASVGAVDIWGVSIPRSQFCCKSKPVLKNKFLNT